MWLRWKSFCTCENFSKPTFFKTSLFARQLIVRQFMKNLFYLSKNEIWKDDLNERKKVIIMHFFYWWIERRYRCMSPSCMLLRQFQFCLETPYQLSFRAIIPKEGNILCCCFIYFSWEFTQQIQICHHLFPVLMQYATRLERKYVISLTMVLC